MCDGNIVGFGTKLTESQQFVTNVFNYDTTPSALSVEDHAFRPAFIAVDARDFVWTNTWKSPINILAGVHEPSTSYIDGSSAWTGVIRHGVLSKYRHVGDVFKYGHTSPGKDPKYTRKILMVNPHSKYSKTASIHYVRPYGWSLEGKSNDPNSEHGIVQTEWPDPPLTDLDYVSVGSIIAENCKREESCPDVNRVALVHRDYVNQVKMHYALDGCHINAPVGVTIPSKYHMISGGWDDMFNNFIGVVNAHEIIQFSEAELSEMLDREEKNRTLAAAEILASRQKIYDDNKKFYDDNFAAVDSYRQHYLILLQKIKTDQTSGMSNSDLLDKYKEDLGDKQYLLYRHKNAVLVAQIKLEKMMSVMSNQTQEYKDALRLTHIAIGIQGNEDFDFQSMHTGGSRDAADYWNNVFLTTLANIDYEIARFSIGFPPNEPSAADFAESAQIRDDDANRTLAAKIDSADNVANAKSQAEELMRLASEAIGAEKIRLEEEAALLLRIAEDAKAATISFAVDFNMTSALAGSDYDAQLEADKIKIQMELDAAEAAAKVAKAAADAAAAEAEAAAKAAAEAIAKKEADAAELAKITEEANAAAILAAAATKASSEAAIAEANAASGREAAKLAAKRAYVESERAAAAKKDADTAAALAKKAADAESGDTMLIIIIAVIVIVMLAGVGGLIYAYSGTSTTQAPEIQYSSTLPDSIAR
jgi:hypothetical protein